LDDIGTRKARKRTKLELETGSKTRNGKGTNELVDPPPSLDNSSRSDFSMDESISCPPEFNIGPSSVVSINRTV